METWMMLAAGAGLIGLLSAVGMLVAWKKTEGGKRIGILAVLAIVGAGAGYLASNATAFTTNEAEAEIEAQIAEDDFDAPLDDEDW